MGSVILISGVGLLLLTMTNRLWRVIDHARQLKHKHSVRTGHEREQTLAKVTILFRRAKVICLSNTHAATTAALEAILIVTALFASLIAFIRDI
jgi:hypothetical protein